jgi:hypothetical protein
MRDRGKLNPPPLLKKKPCVDGIDDLFIKARASTSFGLSLVLEGIIPYYSYFLIVSTLVDLF